MFNSPARANPRRNARARDSVSRHPLFSAESTPAPSGIRTRSNFTSFRDQTPAALSVAESNRTIRAPVKSTPSEADRDKVYWSKDDRHTVLASGALPAEVEQLIRSADFNVDSVAAAIDPVSGFALVTTTEASMAWNFAKRTHSSPTVYRFPIPEGNDEKNLQAVPPTLGAFFAGASTSEPGVILVSAAGEVRFWESMSLALANAQRYQSIQLELGNEYAQHLWKIDASTFVVTTSISTAYRVSIQPVGGRLVPSAIPFTIPGGLFSRPSPTIFSNSQERHGITAAVPTVDGVYFLGRTRLQRWKINPDGTPVLLGQFDLHQTIGANLLEDPAVWASGNLQLTIDDVVGAADGRLAILISYSRTDQYQAYDVNHSRHSHAIIQLDYNHHINSIGMDPPVHLSYLAHPDPRMLDVPRLYIPKAGHTAYVNFGEAIVVVSLSSTPYEDTITLKDSTGNAFIGIGATDALAIRASSSIIAMAAVGGLMTIDVNTTPTQNNRQSATATATGRLKSKIEQAVFFGDRGDNPLSFDLPPGFKGDLAEAAEAVSTEIVSGTAPNMAQQYDVRRVLTDRWDRLHALMAFIHSNGALTLLPEATRRNLCSHAEKVQSAISLWDYQNRMMDQLHSRTAQSLLADSIQQLMDQLGDNTEEDFVRQFFRRHVLDLSRLLDTVFQQFRGAVDDVGQGADLSPWVLETNRIFLIVLRGSARVREQDIDTYQVDRQHPMVELWTANDSTIDELETLYSATQKLIKERTRTLGSTVDEVAPPNATSDLAKKQKDQSTLKQQMTNLAAALCENMEDKLRTSATEVDAGVDPTAGFTLRQRWEELKPRIIRPLVEIDRVTEAYDLAEHHRDFPTLVYLCQNPASNVRGQGRTEEYIERFGADFAFVFYQWLIDHGDLHALLTQPEVYGSLVTEFFAENPHPELSWIHDIACRRYGSAANALIQVNSETPELTQKHLISSIAKLAGVAEMTTMGKTEERSHLLNSIDDELDLITVENELFETIKEAAPKRGYPKEASAEGYAEATAKGLEDRPAFRRLYEQLVERLLAGGALDVEGLVDVLTLRDTPAYPHRDDAAIGIERLSKDSSLPEGRKEVALLSVWRRVFIRDDWASLANTAGRSDEAQRQAIRQTATYSTLKAVKEADIPTGYILSPAMAVQAPTAEEISARFPELGSVKGLMVDHETEIKRLEALIDDAGLEERVKAVQELVDADAQAEDVDM